MMLIASIFAKERQEEGAKNVERGHASGEQADPEHPRRVLIRRFQNQILAEVAGSERHAGNRDAGAKEHDTGDGNLFRQATHLAEVLFAGKSVDHAAGSQEQQSLEERVRHDVEDAGGKRSSAEADEHIAELRNRRVGEDLLDVVLDQADGGGEKRRRDADDSDEIQRHGRVQEQRGTARDHVDAGGDHGGGVDQCADRGGAGHSVG